MTSPIDLYETQRQRYLPLLERLKALFDEMDQAYATAADRYGFCCSGCVDNCCLTRFYHHTLLEWLYLLEGLAGLPPAAREAIVAKAHRVNQQAAHAGQANAAQRIMCPLNQDERCLLYPFRPMICRLHGIPHELHTPGGVVRSPGCDAFFDQCRQHGHTDYIRFDRTPFYRRMAMLERELRTQTGYGPKIKLTVAQMVTTSSETAHEID